MNAGRFYRSMSFADAFVKRMNELIGEGLEFESVALATLRETMGEVPTGVLLAMIGKGPLKGPEPFTRALAAVFGEGARSVLVAIELNGEAIVFGRQSRTRD